MQKRILVTGGSGFLGAALCMKLLRDGHIVTSFDDNSRNTNLFANDHKNLHAIVGDVRDENAVIQASRNCDSIFHLAFINGTENFYNNPKLVLDVGVRGMLSVLRAVECCNIQTFVLASSSEVYQSPVRIPTTEDERVLIPDVQNPRFSYSGGKLISELMTLNYLRGENVRELIFRPHNVFGPSMGFEHVIPQIMMKLCKATDRWKKCKATIQIQGEGNETRAFCFINDAIDQIAMIFENGNKGEIYHIGQEAEISISELVNDIGKILEIEIECLKGPLMPGGTTRRCPNISKVRSLGYEGVNNFQTGLRDTVIWYRDHLSSLANDQ